MNDVNRDQYDQFMVPNYSPMPIIPVRGKGSRVWDQDDREYIDFAGGIAVSAVGHCHPEVVEALTQQANKIWHLSNVMTNEPALELARRLCESTFADRVFLCNSGGEANEAAFKLVRRYAHEHFGPYKHEIIAFDNAFHGRTWFTVSVGGQEKYREGFGPAIEGITHLPFNDIQALEAAVSDRTCAVVVEPIQGEGGVLDAAPGFLETIRRVCSENNALMVLDEVQTGVGRTGALYAYQHHNLTPDVLTSAKGLGGGFPIAAMLTTASIADVFQVGTHGSTYGGNPLGSVVASSVLDIVSQPEVLEGVTNKRERIVKGLEAINEKFKLFDGFRGKGLLLGAVLHPKYAGRARDVMYAALDQGLMLLMAGGDVVRIAPSLLIPDEDIDDGINRLDAALSNFT